MEDVSRWVNLAFVFFSLVLWWVFGQITRSIFGLISKPDRFIIGENLTEASIYGLVAAVAVTGVLWRNKDLYSYGLNIAQELRKVTWPDMDDTKYATRVVIVTTLIIAGILAVFDFTFQHLTSMILGVGS